MLTAPKTFILTGGTENTSAWEENGSTWSHSAHSYSPSSFVYVLCQS